MTDQILNIEPEKIAYWTIVQIREALRAKILETESGTEDDRKEIFRTIGGKDEFEDAAHYYKAEAIWNLMNREVSVIVKSESPRAYAAFRRKRRVVDAESLIGFTSNAANLIHRSLAGKFVWAKIAHEFNCNEMTIKKLQEILWEISQKKGIEAAQKISVTLKKSEKIDTPELFTELIEAFLTGELAKYLLEASQNKTGKE